HGSGGLTAHYRLGARTPVATIFVGVLLLGIGLAFGQAALPVRTVVPYAVFGALLLYVGWQHLLLGLNVPRSQLVFVALVAAVSVLPGSNLAWGLAAGLAAWWGLRVAGPHLPRALWQRLAPSLERTSPAAE
ncbi:MAG: hypothetical protein HY671_05415, partial [Chloroflexi bacterium]|nr:hypothetical protein [Chloroflexota bacterium]